MIVLNGISVDMIDVVICHLSIDARNADKNGIGHRLTTIDRFDTIYDQIVYPGLFVYVHVEIRGEMHVAVWTPVS